MTDFELGPEMAERLISGWVNPLTFLEVDEPWASLLNTAPTFESVLQFLCPADGTVEMSILLARYHEISSEPVRLSFAPNEQRLLDKLVWPLRHAKASYMVGNFLSTLALSGMVGEMVAILFWEIADRQFHGRDMTRDDEKALCPALTGRTWPSTSRDETNGKEV